MLWKRTMVMLAAFLAMVLLAVIVYALPQGGAGPRLNLPTIKKEDIAKITVMGGKEPFTLTKTGQAWQLDPGNFAVDAAHLDRALDQISKLSIGGMVSSSSSSHAKYEVGAEAIILAVFSAQGEAWRLIIGKDSSDRRGNYVRKPDSDKVFVSNNRLRALFAQGPNMWRDHVIAKFDKAKAVKLTLESPEQSLSFAKNEDRWDLERAPESLPAEYRLDAKKVEQIISTMSALNASEFADAPPPLGELGLEPPQFKATVAFSEGQPVTVLVGKEKEKNFYAKRLEQAQVYVIASYQAEKLRMNVDTLRDLHVITVDPQNVQKVEIRNGKDKLVFTKDQQWKLTESSVAAPNGFILDPAKVDGLVRGAANLQGKTLIGKSAPAAAGLQAPEGLVILSLSDGTSKQIKIGKEGEENQTYVAGDQGFVYLVAKFGAKNLLKKVEDFKVVAQQQQQQQMLSPEALQKLPPEIRDQLLQQQRQKIMQNQMMKQIIKQSEKQKGQEPGKK